MCVRRFLNEMNFEVIGEQSVLEDNDMKILRGKEQRDEKASALYEKCEKKKPEMKAPVTQDLMLENLIEVTQEQNVVDKEGTIMLEEEIQRNGDETFGCSQAQDVKIETEKGKHEVIAEENASEERHNLAMEDKPQMNGGIGRCAKQQGHETLVDKELALSRKQTNEVSEDQKKPNRQQNVEHKHQEETYLETYADQDAEGVVHNENVRIQQKASIEEEHEEIVKSLPGSDAAEDAAATVLELKCCALVCSLLVSLIDYKRPKEQ